MILVACLLACDDSGDPSGLGPTGKAGSLARFALSSTHLYAVDEQSLNVYRFLDNGALAKVSTTHISAQTSKRSIIKDNELYIGAQERYAYIRYNRSR